MNSQNIPNLANFDTKQIDKSAKPVVLVDGSYYLFRCFYGLPPLSNSQGLPTNAIRGFLNALNKLKNRYQPEFMAVAFDTKAPTFRHELSEAYKAHRPPMEEDLRVQIPYIHKMIELLGIKLIKMDGFEADDIIGTLAHQSCQSGLPVVISTGDKDMAQLVNDCVILEDSFTGKMTDIDAVVEKFGVQPKQIADYLTLMGDASDGILGIPKIGKKTAAKLLLDYQDIDGILQNLPNIKGVVGKNLLEHQSEIPLNRTLATIVTNLDLPFDLTSLKLGNANHDATIKRLTMLHELYSELEFRAEISATAQSLMQFTTNEIKTQAFNDQNPNTFENSTNQAESIAANTLKSQSNKVDYRTINQVQDFERLLDELSKTSYFAIDTETTHLDWQKAQLVGISISHLEHHAYYIPMGHVDDLGVLIDEQLSLEYVLEKLKPILENRTIGKIGQHLKYDAHIFAKYGIDLIGDTHAPNLWSMDTMLASYVINAAATRHNMDALAKHYLNVTTTTFEDVAGKGAKQISFDKIAIDVASHYACEDADITFRLFNIFSQYTNKDQNTSKLLHNLEIPVAKLLTQMEHEGILINADFLGKLSVEFDKEILKLEQKAENLAGEQFNLASPKQLGEILFDKLGITGGKKTKTGQYSTSESVLSKIDHPLVDVVLEHRSLSKLKSTYTDSLRQAADKHKRVHTSYHQALTSTGRLSSSDPNLQNIPIRTDTGRLIRQAFIAPKNRVILAADYSQIELRLMAHFSGDERLIEAFHQGLDIHTATAAEIMGKSLQDVTSGERRAAKAVNFGLLYGMSAFGLAKQLDVERHVAQEYIKRYFSRYPAIHDYMENTKNFAKSNGYVKTLLDRKLYSPDINSNNRMIKEAAERAAINAPLQGSAAEIIKLAMIAVDKVLPKNHAKLLLQVHDELIFEVDTNQSEQIANLIKDAMQNALTQTAKDLGWSVDFAVPLLVEVGIGNNWDQAH